MRRRHDYKGDELDPGLRRVLGPDCGGHWADALADAATFEPNAKSYGDEPGDADCRTLTEAVAATDKYSCR